MRVMRAVVASTVVSGRGRHARRGRRTRARDDDGTMTMTMTTRTRTRTTGARRMARRARATNGEGRAIDDASVGDASSEESSSREDASRGMTARGRGRDDGDDDVRRRDEITHGSRILSRSGVQTREPEYG